jgi:hypothetical protein
MPPPSGDRALRFESPTGGTERFLVRWVLGAAVGSSLTGSRPDPEVLFGPAAALEHEEHAQATDQRKNHSGVNDVGCEGDAYKIPQPTFGFEANRRIGILFFKAGVHECGSAGVYEDRPA